MKHEHTTITPQARINERLETFYKTRIHNNKDGKHIVCGRPPVDSDVIMMSNDYLSLCSSPRVITNEPATSSESIMSAVFLNDSSPHRLFEREMASFMRDEACVLSQSGWSANTGLLQTIADSETPVYIDMMAHTSLWEGASIAGATAIPFRHNNVDHLRKLITRNGPGIVVVDSVYSTVGDTCPLDKFTELCIESDSIFVVDESHSLGTHGPNGAGLVVQYGLEKEVHFRTASLAKAFAGRAGIISCREEYYDYIIYSSLPAIFSSTLLESDVSLLRNNLRTIISANKRRTTLNSNSKYLRDHLREIGYNIGTTDSQIIPIEAGHEHLTLELRDELSEHGIIGSVFCAPATAKNRSIVRLSVNALHSKDQLNQVINALVEIQKSPNYANWTSTIRATRNQLAMSA